MSAFADGIYLLRVYAVEALRAPGLSWLGIGLALFGVWLLIRR